MADYSQRSGDETKDGRDGRFAESLAKLLALVGVAGHIVFYDVLPAALAWVVGSANGLDLFSGFENPSSHRVAGLGVFLSAVAAIITTESLARLARPFNVGHFLVAALRSEERRVGKECR